MRVHSKGVVGCWLPVPARLTSCHGALPWWLPHALRCAALRCSHDWLAGAGLPGASPTALPGTGGDGLLPADGSARNFSQHQLPYPFKPNRRCWLRWAPPCRWGPSSTASKTLRLRAWPCTRCVPACNMLGLLATHAPPNRRPRLALRSLVDSTALHAAGSLQRLLEVASPSAYTAHTTAWPCIASTWRRALPPLPAGRRLAAVRRCSGAAPPGLRASVLQARGGAGRCAAWRVFLGCVCVEAGRDVFVAFAVAAGLLACPRCTPCGRCLHTGHSLNPPSAPPSSPCCSHGCAAD